MAGDRRRRPCPHPGADRLGEDARRLPPRPRPAERVSRRGPAAALRLTAQGAQLRHRAEPAQPARRPRLEAPRRCAHGRHAGRGATPDAAHTAGHPDHHARVAVPPPHLAGARDAARSRDRDPRRGARRRGDEARRSPRALARAARAAGGYAVPARRALRHPASDGRDRPLRRRHGSPDRARRRGSTEGARPAGRRPGRGHARAGVDLGALGARAGGRRDDGGRRRAVEPLHLAVDLSGDPGPGPSSIARRSSS